MDMLRHTSGKKGFTEMEEDDYKESTPTSVAPYWYFTNKRGDQMYAVRYATTKPLRGLICYFHGMNSHCQSATTVPICMCLSDDGFDVIAFDQAGHGKSATDATRGDLWDWNFLVSDGIRFLTHYYSENSKMLALPLFIAGASMGGTVALLVGLEIQKTISSSEPLAEKLAWMKNFKGCMAVSPPVYNSLEPHWGTVMALKAINALGGGSLALGPSPKPEAFATPEAYKQFLNDKYCYSGAMKLSMGSNMLAMTAAFRALMEFIDFPFIVLHGTADSVIPLKGSQELFQNSATESKDKSLIVFEGGEHNLVSNDEFRKKTAAHLLGWAGSRLDINKL